MTRLDTPAEPPLVTRLTDNVTLLALVLVAVNLSMMVLQLTAVYCVVCAFSACFDGIRVFTRSPNQSCYGNFGVVGPRYLMNLS